MRGKAFIPLALGLCVGLLAVKFGVDAIKKAQGGTQAPTEIQIVRAKLDIGAYEKITEEMVELATTTDKNLIPESDRVGSLEDVVDRVTAKAIPSRAPVLQSMLAPEGTSSGMVGRIPLGQRAVSVRIDEVTGVAFQVKPGDYVDVIVVMDVETGERQRKKTTIAEVILQNIQVAAIGRDTTGAPGEAGGKVKPAKSATLLVDEEDVPKLHLAATRGKITLAMRGDNDRLSQHVGPADENDVFQYLRDRKAEKPETKPEPAPPVRVVMVAPEPEPEPEPDPPYSVLIRRGSTIRNVSPKAERVAFENAESSTIIGVSEGLAVPQTKKPSMSKMFGEKEENAANRKPKKDTPARDDDEPGDEDTNEGE